MSTPLDKNSRYFGEYRCPKCRRLWMSANSWVGFAQQCISCETDVLPYKQVPVEKSGKRNKINPQKDHLQELCQKCRALGKSCETE